MSEVGGVSGWMESQIQDIMKDFGQIKQIVIDIFQDLEDFKAAQDKAMAKESLEKIRERMEELSQVAENMGPRSGNLLAKVTTDLQNGLDNLRLSGASSADAQAFSKIQQQIDDLKGKAQGLA